MRFLAFLLASIGCLFAQTPPPHPAWSGDKVHEIRLRFKQPDYWEKLTANYLGSEERSAYLEGSLEWGPYKFDSVGVRFKGNSSYRGASTRKKPFRIKLNEFVKGQKIEGIGAFNLSNGWNDPSLVREPPYYELATALGLKAPRTNYAALYINGQYWGLYVLGEVVNGDFLKNYFGQGEDSGNLYKANTGATFGYLGENKAAYKAAWEKQTNEEADDWTDLIELCRIIDQTPAAELRAKLEPLVDIDSVLTATALDNATINLDSYIGLGQNFNIYRRPSDKRWVWLVWDPSLAFGGFGQGGAGVQLETEYVQRGGVPAGRPLAAKLWEIPEYKERYRQIYKDLVNRVFLADKTVARMTALRSMIRPYVAADEQKLATLAQFDEAMTATFGTGALSAPALQPFIEGRLAWLKTQLNPQTFPAARIAASTAALNFSMATGGTNPASQTVSLQYSGVNTPPTYSLSAQTLNGGNWLTPNITGGALPGSVQISVSGKDLPAGVYSGSVTAYLAGSPEVVIPITLTVGTVPAASIAAVVNAASYSTGAISPGQLATIFGENLGAAGLKVTFDGAAAELLYVTANQIGVIVPTSISGKTTTSIQAAYGSQVSEALTKTVTPTAPGLFTTNSSGTGPGAIINQTGTINSATAPAAKESIIAIYLTGGAAATTANVTIGGQAATVAYAGAAPGSVQGLYQVNATVPAAVASGAQPVVVTIGGVASQSGVTVSVQ